MLTSALPPRVAPAPAPHAPDSGGAASFDGSTAALARRRRDDGGDFVGVLQAALTPPPPPPPPPQTTTAPTPVVSPITLSTPPTTPAAPALVAGPAPAPPPPVAPPTPPVATFRPSPAPSSAPLPPPQASPVAVASPVVVAPPPPNEDSPPQTLVDVVPAPPASVPVAAAEPPVGPLFPEPVAFPAAPLFPPSVVLPGTVVPAAPVVDPLVVAVPPVGPEAAVAALAPEAAATTAVSVPDVLPSDAKAKAEAEAATAATALATPDVEPTIPTEGDTVADTVPVAIKEPETDRLPLESAEAPATASRPATVESTAPRPAKGGDIDGVAAASRGDASKLPHPVDVSAADRPAAPAVRDTSAPPTPPAPVPPALVHATEVPRLPVVDQVARAVLVHAEVVRTEGRVEFHLRLEPPELGTVRVHLTLTEQTLSARLVVRDAVAQQLIEGQIESLRQRLAEMGVSVGRCDVSGDGGRRDGHGPWNGPRLPYRGDPTDDSPAIVGSSARPAVAAGRIDVMV